jgi:hypothetical protein
MSLTAEKVLVGMSRAAQLNRLRILPFAPGQIDNHLHSLNPNALMLHWFARYGPDGIWSAQRSAQSIQKFPLSLTKNKHKKIANTSGKGASEKTRTSKSTAIKTTKTPSKNASNSLHSVQISSQFRLNLAHAITSDPANLCAKLFNEFFLVMETASSTHSSIA